jgi:DNA-binding MarR family transcriptional regulator
MTAGDDMTRSSKRRQEPGTDYLEPGDSPGFLLWRVSLRWQRLMTATLRPLGLTHVQFVLLASLWWLTAKAGERPTQRRLAEFAATDPMMTSQVLRALEGRRLVGRSPHPTDSRARQLAVTSQASELVRHALHAVEAADRQFFEHATGRRPVRDFLRILAEAGDAAGPSRTASRVTSR